MPRFETIAFDADDTLWHNEHLYVGAQAKLKQLLGHYHSPEWVDERLYQTEMRNLQHFGYGIKAFALSMIETALELTEGRVSGGEIRQIIDAAKEMLTADVDLLEHVAETLASLEQAYPLMLITKGDLRDQELKIARSGLAARFRYVEIVSDKSPASYEVILRRHGIAPDRFLMIGNSLRSDILPVLAIGGQAVHVPYAITWAHEHVDVPPEQQGRYHELEHLGQLPALLRQLSERRL